jgi:hypothetical protein
MMSMRRVVQFAIAGTVATLCACTVENNQSLAILFNAARADDCTLDPNTDKYIPSGILDVSLGQGYEATFVVQNRMAETVNTQPVTTGNQTQDTTERNLVTLRGFNVSLDTDCNETEAECSAVRAQIDARGQTFAPNAIAIEPHDGRAATAVEIIRDDFASALQGHLGNSRYAVRATVTAFGGRNPDETLESGDFDYYVTLCEKNCLVRGNDPPQPCPGGSAEGNCGRPQDFPLDVCFEGGTRYQPASSAPSAP